MLRKSTDSLVIKPRLSATARLAVIVAAIVIVAAASLAGYYGGRAVLHDRVASSAAEVEKLEEALRDSRAARRAQQEELAAERRRLTAELESVRAQLESELEDSRERLENTRQRLEDTESSLVRVNRQLQIDQTAYRELRRELEASNRQITELAGELKFYRSIISPADGRSGVRIQEFDLQPSGADHEYRYRLILIQALEHDEPALGAVRFEITGMQDGETRTIHSPSATGEPIPAEFRYFQNFVGTFTFPAGFMPAEVKVIFESGDDVVVQHTYPWPDHGSRGDA